jgi:hypothetical protein
MKSQKVNVGYRAYIEWLDSYASYGWVREILDSKDFLIKSIGVITHSTDDFITISTSLNPDGGCNSPLSIPWCSISKFKQYESLNGNN